MKCFILHRMPFGVKNANTKLSVGLSSWRQEWVRFICDDETKIKRRVEGSRVNNSVRGCKAQEDDGPVDGPPSVVEDPEAVGLPWAFRSRYVGARTTFPPMLVYCGGSSTTSSSLVSSGTSPASVCKTKRAGVLGGWVRPEKASENLDVRLLELPA